MQFNEKELNSIKELIDKSNRILIIPHKAPDGDAIGAALGLFQVFSQLGKSPMVRCFDEPPGVFSFMPNIEKVQIGLTSTDYDAIFIVDSGATHLTGFNESHPQLFDKSLEVINIDHHPSNEFYGKYNLVVTEASSATQILYEMCMNLDLPIDRNTATCFLTGIYTDTGSFMHSNTTPEVMKIAARLLAKGANLRSISKDLFNTTKISTMRLWGRVLKNTYQTTDSVTMSVVTEKDFEDTGAEYSEMTGAVDYVNSVPESKYSVILTERDGKVKGSLRTLREEVDVAAVASAYGGGGHTKAAGFTIPGYLEKEIRWKVVDN
ncbi:bifunctional oligoribonuclease/PAP phosphatase NrnA [Patescibacteria group bacterium]|nr:bifunctional oligoribonuclease/PAP phosphatase NrnA [Patescibacteria group bacterium]MBU1682832.1 bifunctional oligoribonuclease/PAP phosphatase NrnA [Patescibacteria group bacterium]MBU1935343.1 bifunctional oligoribonuclease/PAP phosphatase NrnA [Patescibacteria group bacterium]